MYISFELLTRIDLTIDETYCIFFLIIYFLICAKLVMYIPMKVSFAQ